MISQHLTDMNRQIEDLDNRGRNYNIRVRGIAEAVTTDQIKPALSSIFYSLIERPDESPIEYDRAHRALRPRAPDKAPPRDIICCLPNFCLKGVVWVLSYLSNQWPDSVEKRTPGDAHSR